MDERIKYIADYYGRENQLHQLMEECCELALEANHSARHKSLKLNMINEIADVEIMIAQVKYLFGISTKDLAEVREYKINRQMERIENDIFG